MKRPVLSRKRLLQITDVSNERNIYAHPNPLARAIFWQRLSCLHSLMVRRLLDTAHVLDFGGGSGVFAPMLSAAFAAVDILDRDSQDARNIKAHFALENVTVLDMDIITEYAARPVYDGVVAADVLEHFKDLAAPMAAIHGSLKPGGRLFVSLPTENALYRIGRRVLGKQKPADHYHTAAFVIARLEEFGFVLEVSRHVPCMIFTLPLFRVAVFEKPVSSSAETAAAHGRFDDVAHKTRATERNGFSAKGFTPSHG